MGFAPTWLRQGARSLLHKTTLNHWVQPAVSQQIRYATTFDPVNFSCRLRKWFACVEVERTSDWSMLYRCDFSV